MKATMQVSEQKLSDSRHLKRTGHWSLLLLLLFAIALGSVQREGISILAPMIGQELKLDLPAIGSEFVSFRLASTAGFLLMAVFIWREKSWL